MKCFRSLSVVVLYLAAILVVLSASQVLAEWVQVATLTPSDGVMGDRFGYGVAFDGTRALVAASSQASGRGAAYLYEPDGSGGYTEYKLLPADPAAEDVGSALALSGDYAYVGARKADVTVGETTYTDAGAVCVFKRNVVGETVTWDEVATIVAPTPVANALFGSGIGIDGGVLCIGASNTPAREATWYTGSGASWTSDQTVVESGYSQFGAACVVDGTTTAVAAHLSGRVFIYDYDAGTEDWVETKVLTGSSSARFGINSRMDGDNLVAGADRTTVSGLSRAGAAYIHNRDQDGEDAWGQVAMLTSDDPQTKGAFGYSNSIDGNRLVIGAFGEDHGTDADTGAVYVFEYGSSWTQVDKFFGPVAGEQFGVGVSLVGDNVLIGDYSATAGNKAYIYHYVPEPGMIALLIGLAWGGVLLRGHRR